MSCRSARQVYDRTGVLITLVLGALVVLFIADQVTAIPSVVVFGAVVAITAVCGATFRWATGHW